MSEELKALARGWYDAMTKAFATGDMNALDAFIVADFVEHNPSPGQGPGLAGLKQLFAGFQSAFPDMNISAEDVIAEGDKVAARFVMRGMNTGSFAGMPATGKQVTVEGIDILRVEGGKIVEHWGQYDQLGMMQQLGAVPTPG
ncbi:MAG: ester cyclase [Chloroflexi bacterium]|nr:ester cyclase [Chloroflexota bacterium]